MDGGRKQKRERKADREKDREKDREREREREKKKERKRNTVEVARLPIAKWSVAICYLFFLALFLTLSLPQSTPN